MSISAMKEALEALALFASDESDDGQMAISAYESLRQAIAEAEDAVAAEREACAKLVEADADARGKGGGGLVLLKAASRIRARGEK
jgi:hypothetical protein